MTIALPTEGFAKLDTVLAAIPISRAKWYEGVKSGLYPRPVRLDGRSVAWRVEDIRSVINRINEKNQNQTLTLG
ncbi:helix-turn-helix transcriptional regulator [Methylomonas rosea]|uniref:AlpA family phage regulatory protein n=1 Tax=Methylomonas rosea TaxID=2952227 RepID=A0ABT1TYH6_9GAMM|nr:AlpA family phage regulatory protein [Methylomonas sp. WSC-7]MCQ8119825.1 AlpA family phage regulatory protein [Methylomonas sp. WSC-7]